MSEQDVTHEELRAALRELSAHWLAKSQEADKHGRQLSVGNIQQALYQRGLAEGLRLALADVQQLLTAGQPIAPLNAITDVAYAPVSRKLASSVLVRAGLTVSELHEHNDHTFSAILPPLQVLSFEELVNKLSAIADIVILAKGRLPNSSKAYIDFAFLTEPAS